MVDLMNVFVETRMVHQTMNPIVPGVFNNGTTQHLPTHNNNTQLATTTTIQLQKPPLSPGSFSINEILLLAANKKLRNEFTLNLAILNSISYRGRVLAEQRQNYLRRNHVPPRHCVPVIGNSKLFCIVIRSKYHWKLKKRQKRYLDIKPVTV